MEEAMATDQNTTPQRNPESWRTTIDGWVRDPAIRNFGLTTLVVLVIVIVIVIVIVVGLTSGALLAAVNTLLPNLLAKTIAGSAISTAGGTLWFLKRRANRRTKAIARSLNDAPND
jgi:hypothetical protein